MATKSGPTNSKNPCLIQTVTLGREWAVLSEEEKKIFNQNVICRTYDNGESIFYEGDNCKGLYLVESGLIGVRKTGTEGEPVLLRLAHPGDALGYRPLLAGENHRGEAQAIIASKVCFLPKTIMRRLLISNPDLGAWFLQQTAQALGAADNRFFETVTLPARVRLIHLLMILRERYGHVVEDGSLSLDLQLSRRDLASMLGIRAESLSRIVREIESEGLAEFSGKHITIADPDLLMGELNTCLKSLS